MEKPSKVKPQSGRLCYMRKRFFWLLVIALTLVTIALGVGLGVGLTQNDDSKNSNTDINATLAEIVQDNYFPALGVGYDNGTYHSAVAGIRRIGNPENATVDDIWHFGSNTKAMTATTVAILIQDDLLRWTSTLEELLKGTGIRILDVYANVTVEQLSSHTSGISDDTFATNIEKLLATYELSAADGRIFASNVTLTTTHVWSQDTYEYANMNYVLLGLIIDAITGESAESVVQSRLWDPLLISTGGWGPNPERSLTSIDNPWPHIGNSSAGKTGLPTPLPIGTRMVERDNPPCYHTAGAAHMTLADYHKWLRLHFDPAVQARLNLSVSTMQKLHKVNRDTSSNLYTYGGWSRLNASSGSGYSLSHDGSNTMNFATAIIEVGERRAASVVTNVGGNPLSGTPWVDGTHSTRDDLMNGKIQF